MDRKRWTRVACLLSLVAGCSSQPAILLTVTGDQPAQQYQLFVHDDDTSTLVYSSGFTSVSTPGQPPLDLTKDSLKLALKLSRGGHFTLLMVGVIGQIIDGKPGPTSTAMFWATKLNVTGATNVNAELLTVPPGDDDDGDFWPDVKTFRQHVPAAARLYAGKDTVLDCDDKTNNPVTPTGVTVPLKASQINPFATPICGIGYSVSCDGTTDPCVDKDGDHDVRGHDCDDSDPKRHHPTDIDPFPDPPNCCGYSLGKQGTPDEFTDFLVGGKCYAAGCKPDKLLCPAKRCGDGIDESCRAVNNDPKNDTTCVVDEDCDGYPAPPQGNDCDDHDPKVHPGAAEPCGSTKDMNCNGTIGEGCIPCDLDGDGYQRKDVVNNCPDKNDKHPGMSDCNDDDAGVFPGSTAITGGTEAGVSIGVVASGLRGYCRNVYESVNGGTLTPKINPFGGLVGDADCNGVAYQGCPGLLDPGCDKDGDGFPVADMVNGKSCQADVNNKKQLDCDDTDPKSFPGAPDNCKTPFNENCITPVADCSQDADGDGYLKGADCNDNDPNIHPWATEVCNGIDDDCDGLVDEGNPDPTGKPLVSGGAVESCTQSNTGECGKQLGSCVCSASTPVVDPLIAMLAQPRTMCPGEGSPGRAPGCFGAGQPAPQSCDATNPKDDDCDGRVDAKDGVRLAAKGMTCGINVGQCKAGIVVGCDKSSTNCFTSFSRLPATSAWLVCSSAGPNPITVCPTAEVCNGLDDDCDGHVPGDVGPPPTPGTPGTPPDEFDHDRDHYMACLGCGTTLGAGILGCGDCDDTNANLHPGLPELCDGIDNACAAYNSQTFVDGKDDCKTGTKTTCCGANGCHDVHNGEPGFCGSCTIACSMTAADNCANNGCVCGTTGAPCLSTKTCQAGHCVVGAGIACPNGQPDCVSGTTCIDGVCCTVPQGCGTCGQCTGAGGTCVFTPPGGNPLNGTCAKPMACDGVGHCKQGFGGSCTGDGDCFNGMNCFDGVCCQSACGGQCQHCTAPMGLCVQTVGKPVSIPPRSDCAGSTSPGMACYGKCDATGGQLACDYPTVACGQLCVAGAGTTPAVLQNQVCDGTGGCVAGTGSTACGDPDIIKCAGKVCQGHCTGDGDCISTDYCSSATGADGMMGLCKPRKADTTACTAPDCYGGGTGCAFCANPANGSCRANGECCTNNCAAPACSDAMHQQVTHTCLGDGTCPGTTTDCGNFKCDPASHLCRKSCTADSQCRSGNYCDAGGACSTQIATGKACGFTADCFGMPTMTSCAECANGNHLCSAAVGGMCP